MTETKVIDVSDRAICDDCASVYTALSPDVGGILFESKAICQACAPKWEASAAKYGETHFIVDRACVGERFFDAVMRWRGGNNDVRITGSREFIAEMSNFYEGKT